MASLIGSKVERKEDKKFLTGKGRYTADISLAHQTYAYFVRSPHARAKINKVDISKALKAPGVVNIFTGEDIAREKIGGLIAGFAAFPRKESQIIAWPWLLLLSPLWVLLFGVFGIAPVITRTSEVLPLVRNSLGFIGSIIAAYLFAQATIGRNIESDPYN